MLQSDVTGYHMVKYQVCDPESKAYKGHGRWEGPRQLQGRAVKGWDRGSKKGHVSWTETHI